MTNAHALLVPGARTEWETPWSLFDPLNQEFDFTLDVAASKENTRCLRYLTAEDDALTVDWAEYIRRECRPYRPVCWLNPPYGPGIGRWLAKAAAERLNSVTTVCLLPARTDTRWWHQYVWDASTHHPHTGVEVRFLAGRVRFELGGKPAPAGSTFPSVLVIFRGAP